MIHSITIGIQKNIGDLSENLDKAMDKYNATPTVLDLSQSHQFQERKRKTGRSPNIERNQHPNIESEGLV